MLFSKVDCTDYVHGTAKALECLGADILPSNCQAGRLTQVWLDYVVAMDNHLLNAKSGAQQLEGIKHIMDADKDISQVQAIFQAPMKVLHYLDRQTHDFVQSLRAKQISLIQATQLLKFQTQGAKGVSLAVALIEKAISAASVAKAVKTFEPVKALKLAHTSVQYMLYYLNTTEW